jgi:hypothetical protein
MNEIVLVIVAMLILLVALMALNGSMRVWVFRALGIESRIENATHQTKVTARKRSSVKDVRNETGTINADAQDDAHIEDVKNIKK